MLCRGEINKILICDIGDQITKHAYASKGTQIVYWNPNLHKNKEIQPIWKVHLKIEFILDRVIFDTID